MNVRLRLCLCSLLAAVGFAAACSTESSSNGDACAPNEQRSCQCDDGTSGTQTCNSVGAGFSDCDCSVDAGTGGSGGGPTGGSGGQTGGSAGTAGTGGSGGASGGSGGTDMDASAPDGSSSTPDGGDQTCDLTQPDGAPFLACDTCLRQQCCAELYACDGDPCSVVGTDGITEAECMFTCLDGAMTASDAGADGGDGGSDGMVDAADLAECASLCGTPGSDAGGGVSAATEALFTCLLGSGSDAGTDCRTDCGY